MIALDDVVPIDVRECLKYYCVAFDDILFFEFDCEN